MSDIKSDLDIAELVKEYGITTFIETGCFEGTTLAFATSLGLKSYSCDINDDYIKNCQIKCPDATIYFGESVNFFKEYLPIIPQPSWFWLDAHYPNIYRRPKLFTMANYFPLFVEMLLIKELKPNYKYDIIMCDDIGNIEAEDNPLYTELPPEAYPAKGHLLQEYKDVFKDTHNVEVLTKGCGLMVCLPKEKR